jgi:hypothetical protein
MGHGFLDTAFMHVRETLCTYMTLHLILFKRPNIYGKSFQQFVTSVYNMEPFIFYWMYV